jgi:tetratricopeptide (TPR) repeat protein
LGLAYVGAARTKALARHAPEYTARARAHLTAAYRAGARDADLIFTLADLAARAGDTGTAAALARAALDAPGLAPITRAQCLDLLTVRATADRNWRAAAGLMEQVVRRLRFGADWAQLGNFYLDDRNTDKALPAFRRAIDIWPFYPDAHHGVAECYRRTGDTARAAAHHETGQCLQRNAKR